MNLPQSKKIRHMLIDVELTIGQLAEIMQLHRSTLANAINEIRQTEKEISVLKEAETVLRAIYPDIKFICDK